jgi:hypothetical protein
VPQDIRRPWTEDDIAKFRTLAQKLPVAEISAQLARSPGALVAKAHQLKLSLRMEPKERGGVWGIRTMAKVRRTLEQMSIQNI